MLYKLIIKEEAKLEISDAYLYYEEQQTGLGERFLSEIEKGLMTWLHILNIIALLTTERFFAGYNN